MQTTPNAERRRFDRAEGSEVFTSFNGQWGRIAHGRRMRSHLRQWAMANPVLASFRDAAEVIDTIRDPAADEQLRRRLLEAIASQASTDEVAMTATLAALIPRLASLVNRSAGFGIDVEERSSAVISMAHDVILSCPPGTARSWYDRRLWSNISKRYRRWVRNELTTSNTEATTPFSADAAVEVGVRRELVEALSVEPEPISEDFELSELCRWVAECAHIDFDTARLIVLSRAGGVPIEDLVNTGQLKPQSVRRRRQRAETRFVEAFTAGPIAA